MRNLLELENNRLVINAQALTIKEFEIIWNRDKSKTKANAIKEFAYIYYIADYQSIYNNYHPDIRNNKIVGDLFMKNWAPDEKIKKAIAKYKELQTTTSMALLRDVEQGIDKLRKYFTNVDFANDTTGTKAKNFINITKQLGDLIRGMKRLREEVEKELVNEAQLRGGSKIGNRELPKERRE